MTINELILEITDQLNLSSDEAKARVARKLNIRYRTVTTAIGLAPSRRTRVTKAASVGNRDLTFTGIEKVDNVIDASSGRDLTLDELSHDEMIEKDLRSEPPKHYSIETFTPTTVTIRMDCTPTTTFTLKADGIASATTLSGNDSPAFPESFHDVLIHGVMADEYFKQEKPDLMDIAERNFIVRLSDLKMFVAKSAYLDLYPGKLAPREGWWDTRTRTRAI